MLALHGTATACYGVKPNKKTSVVRSRQIDGRLGDRADFVVARSEDEFNKAVSAKSGGVILIGNEDIASRQTIGDLSKLIVLPSQFSYLAAGDIIGIEPQSRRFRTLYRCGSSHNSFLVTDRCNHYCLMCSQPPKSIDDGWIIEEIKQALPLVDKSTLSLGFTGGEPLLNWPQFVQLLTICRDELPATSIHVLSNGRAFARDEVVAAWAKIQHPHLMVGIPIYAAIDHIHDYVVQARGAFDETILGILKLKDRGQRIEVRVVLHSITAPRISETCRWLARNLRFVNHIALMGLENTGFALANADLLHIDPLDYAADLAEAVNVLGAAKMNVSIYNLPRCVLHPAVLPYAVKSISDWKNTYLEVCRDCAEKHLCSGFFATGRLRQSRGITPILASR